MFSSPAWVFSDEDEDGTKRRFWETNLMLWAYRLSCLLAIAVVIPMLRCVTEESLLRIECSCSLPLDTGSILCE